MRRKPQITPCCCALLVSDIRVYSPSLKCCAVSGRTDPSTHTQLVTETWGALGRSKGSNRNVVNFSIGNQNKFCMLKVVCSLHITCNCECFVWLPMWFSEYESTFPGILGSPTHFKEFIELHWLFFLVFFNAKQLCLWDAGNMEEVVEEKNLNAAVCTWSSLCVRVASTCTN